MKYIYKNKSFFITYFYCNLLKLISNIQLILVLSVVFLYVSPQVYALKEFVNDEYNIKFQYPEDWMQLQYTTSKEFEVEYDRIYLPELWMEVKINDYENMQIILYTDMPNLKEFVKTIKKEVIYDPIVENNIQDIKYMNQTGLQSAIINTNHLDPLTGLSFNLDYILFDKNGVGYAIKYVSTPQNTDKYLNNVLNITNQIMSDISK